MERLTWDDLADLYDQNNAAGRSARTLPMDTVAKHLERDGKIKVDDEGYYCRAEPPQ